MDPITLASIGIGAAKGVTGILGAFGQNQAETEAARRQNEKLKRLYRQLSSNIVIGFNVPTLCTEAGCHQQTLRNNERARSLAEGRNQQRINDVIKQQSVQTQNMMANWHKVKACCC